MYKQFFGFTDEVFKKSIKEEHMFHSSSFKELIKRFEYMSRHRGIMLLCGDPGSGKTSAVRYFLSTLHENSYFTVYMPLATVAVGDFYRQLNTNLHGEHVYSKSLIFRSIQSQIKNMVNSRNVTPVIIFDESHLFRDQNFKELQIITNFEYDTIDPAIFIIVGQPVLLDRMDSYNLNSFNQRINMKYKISNLTQAETKDYVLHHFKICNRDAPILTEPAFKAVYNVTNGIPRVIGKLIKKALIYAALKKAQTINEDDIVSISSEL